MKAPQFNLFNQNREEVSLSSYLGQSLIINFFPQAFTSVCTTQLCHMRDNLNKYKDLGVEVVGISVDSLFTLNAYAQQNNYSFPLLSDFNKEVSKAYDAYLEDFAFGMKGVSKRAVFVINATGGIVYQEICDSVGDAPNFEQLKIAIEKL